MLNVITQEVVVVVKMLNNVPKKILDFFQKVYKYMVWNFD